MSEGTSGNQAAAMAVGNRWLARACRRSDCLPDIRQHNAVSRSDSAAALPFNGCGDLRRYAADHVGRKALGQQATGWHWPDLLFVISVALADLIVSSLHARRGFIAADDDLGRGGELCLRVSVVEICRDAISGEASGNQRSRYAMPSGRLFIDRRDDLRDFSCHTGTALEVGQ